MEEAKRFENIALNKFQTPITKELLDQYPKEVQEQFWEFVLSVPFIKNLISSSRQRAKDRPRDEKGRIIVDLTNPHILENMDYFRPAAIKFQKDGRYIVFTGDKEGYAYITDNEISININNIRITYTGFNEILNDEEISNLVASIKFKTK